jgi:hypothetical protein
MSLAIFVPSRILADMLMAPGFGCQASARKSYTEQPL